MKSLAVGGTSSDRSARRARRRKSDDVSGGFVLRRHQGPEQRSRTCRTVDRVRRGTGTSLRREHDTRHPFPQASLTVRAAFGKSRRPSLPAATARDNRMAVFGHARTHSGQPGARRVTSDVLPDIAGLSRRAGPRRRDPQRPRINMTMTTTIRIKTTVPIPMYMVESLPCVGGRSPGWAPSRLQSYRRDLGQAAIRYRGQALPPGRDPEHREQADQQGKCHSRGRRSSFGFLSGIDEVGCTERVRQPDGRGP